MNENEMEWWKGKKLDQTTHDRINAVNYPGTRQLCSDCNSPTGRCEDDDLWLSSNYGPLCEDCFYSKICYLCDGPLDETSNVVEGNDREICNSCHQP